MINIVDGLKFLGVLFYGNFNNWKIGLDLELYFFNYDFIVNYWDCLVVVLSNYWFEYY